MLPADCVFKLEDSVSTNLAKFAICFATAIIVTLLVVLVYFLQLIVTQLTHNRIAANHRNEYGTNQRRAIEQPNDAHHLHGLLSERQATEMQAVSVRHGG